MQTLILEWNSSAQSFNGGQVPPRSRPYIGGQMDKHSRFEKARIIGSRALQISMGAPVSIDVPEDTIDPVLIAQMEYDQEVIPITVIDREKK